MDEKGGPARQADLEASELSDAENGKKKKRRRDGNYGGRKRKWGLRSNAQGGRRKKFKRNDGSAARCRKSRVKEKVLADRCFRREREVKAWGGKGPSKRGCKARRGFEQVASQPF